MKSVPDRKVSRRYVYAAVLIGAGLGAGAYRIIATTWGNQADSRSPPAMISVPTLVRNGTRIEVPEGSPLRNKLTIDAVMQKTIERTLVLPAVVEADPARLVKVLPPLSGRITQLQVQLGQLVESGQPLAILESSDLRTAYADYDRAKVLLELASKNRDRLRNLVKTQAISVKELQQAETDFVTAEAEFQRAEARLKFDQFDWPMAIETHIQCADQCFMMTYMRMDCYVC